MVDMTHDYDSPWKEAIEHLFPEFMTFFFPRYADEIDWLRPHQFLDKELEKIVRDAEIGRRYADKLVQVWLKIGTSIEVFIHIEVQNACDPHFSARMCVYNHRISERYVGAQSNNKVASFAIICFSDKDNRVGLYERTFWGSKMTFTFPVVNITDYRARWDELAHSRNVFAVVVMAHLKAADVTDDQERKYWKFKLMKDLYQRGLERIEIVELFRFIDWLIDLPEPLNQQFWSELYALEEERNMSYVTSIERMGIQKGIVLGTEQGIERGTEQGELKMVRESILEVLDDKFGQTPDQVVKVVHALADRDVLKALLKLAAKSVSMDQFMAKFGAIASRTNLDDQ